MPIALPLSRLDDVDWASLEHAYGDASDVPDHLRAIAAGDDDALDQILYSLDHQGVMRFESTLRAVPFLVGLIAERATPRRGAIARILAEFAVGDTAWFLHDGFHPERQVRPDDCARAQASTVIEGAGAVIRGFPTIGDGHDMTRGHGLLEIHEAICEGIPVYLAALEEPDAPEDLRASIPFLCAWLTTHATAIAPALAARIERDHSPSVRASAMLGLSHVVKFDPDEKRGALSLLLARHHAAHTPVERRCLALALSRFEEPSETVDARAELRADLARGVPAAMPDEDFPWQRIDSPPFVFCEAFLGAAPDDRAPVIAAGLACLPTITDPDDAADLAVWLARLAMPEAAKTLAAHDPSWHYTDLANALRERGYTGERDELKNL
ncbi:MAG TPA: hypothetical protein VL463_12000 [Kofleriaceae bacterium]|jgi:hypothetical protein|nr:hypothetical protein [Kofleriaceae bacterium]